MKALIFGINGQDGFYLSETCRKNKVEIIGVSRSQGNWMQGNVSNFQFVESLIKTHQPNYVFHFAANSTTQHYALFENHEAISTGTLNILESVRLHSPKSRVFLSGSAMQFENTGEPIDEQTPFEASSPYSVARIQSVYAGRYFRQKFGLKVYVGYFFNHDSPLRSEKHINQKIAQFVKNIDKNRGQKLEIGDIKTQKEFNFAGDVVEAVWLLVNQDRNFETVIGSGKAYKIEDWLHLCFANANRNWQDYVTVKPNFQSEYEILVSNPALIKSIGWQPKTSIEDLAKMMLG
ncbi:MAG: GDP-mannose 4,6-dehydratase [Pyrinomonadaceae bacterium]|nr:GDP-mannose 4,6-dehydratase [Pyrinomonadaceae bacterium]